MHIEDLFTPAQQALVAGLHRRDQQERQAGSTDPLRLRAVSPQVAHYLCLTAIQHSRTLVEFGTSHGYSTLHLGRCAQRTGAASSAWIGCLRKRRWRGQFAPSWPRPPSGMLHRGGDRLYRDPSRRVDFVFVDFGLPAFAPMFTMLESRLVSGAFLFVDGWSKVEQWDQNPAWAAFRSRLDETSNWLTYILPLEKSHLIAVKLACERS